MASQTPIKIDVLDKKRVEGMVVGFAWLSGVGCLLARSVLVVLG